jgi:23S rRNA (adenine2503-C2)-methyltransferase
VQAPLRSVSDLRQRLADLGARPGHVRRLLTAWLAGERLEQLDPPDSARPSRAVREGLPALQAALDDLVVELERHPAGDGSCRRLMRLQGGRTIEGVDLPREGLCVSTQVGCAVGCRFCRTGEDGLVAQLSPLELLAQVALGRRERPVRRVVFMGMGEPAHNLTAVLEAIAVLGDEGRLPHKNLVFSTVGEPAVFERLLAHAVRPALALSLHTLDPARRVELLPRAPRIAPEPLLDAALAYADRTTYPLLVQWTLLEGLNDSPDEALRLAGLLAGRRAIVNYIPFNAVEGSGFRRPAIERCVELVRTLKAQRVLATLRHSAGQAVDGACGQLRARHAAR